MVMLVGILFGCTLSILLLALCLHKKPSASHGKHVRHPTVVVDEAAPADAATPAPDPAALPPRHIEVVSV